MWRLAVIVATLAVAPAAVAETIIFTAELLPENVMPPPTVPPGTNPVGLAVIKLTLVRDFANKITAASFDPDIGLVGFGRVNPDIPCLCAVEYVLFVPSDFFVRVKAASNPTPGTDRTALAIVKLELNKNFSGNVTSAVFD